MCVINTKVQIRSAAGEQTFAFTNYIVGCKELIIQ